jgi:hypothetical protein
MAKVFFAKQRLGAAIIEGDIAKVKELLDRGVDVNMHMLGACSPLHLAADKGKTEIAALLVVRGAAIDRLSDYQWAPIHNAAYHGHFDIVVDLLKAGADPNLRTSEGKTAYGWALARSHPEVAELLEPYMKKVVDFAVEHNLKTEQPAEKPEGWAVLSPQQIARTETHAQLGYRLTDIFNFRDRERLRIVNNLATKADQVESRSFDDFADKASIETARLALQARGGMVPETELTDRLNKLPRPPGA